MTGATKLTVKLRRQGSSRTCNHAPGGLACRELVALDNWGACFYIIDEMLGAHTPRTMQSFTLDSLLATGVLKLDDATADHANTISTFVNAAYRGDSAAQGWTSEVRRGPTHTADRAPLSALCVCVCVLATQAAILGGQRTDAASVADMIAAPGHCIRLLHFQRSVPVPPAAAPLADRIQLIHGAGESPVLLASIHLEQHLEQLNFGMFAVDPRLQGLGLGKWMLAQVEHRARSMQLCSVGMTVISCRHELIAFYQRCGFSIPRPEERTPFPQDPRFGIPMRGDLEFVAMEKQLGQSK